jgi:thiamine pyrophosphate-dependent acetolactate synthase large subunit-like protein
MKALNLFVAQLEKKGTEYIFGIPGKKTWTL